MAEAWIYATSAAAIGDALISGWLLDPVPSETSPQARQSPATQVVSALTAALAAPTANTTHTLVPVPVAAPTPYEWVTLWQGELRSREGAQSIPEYLAQTEPALLDTLALGQVLEMSLSGCKQPLQARLASTYNSVDLPA